MAQFQFHAVADILPKMSEANFLELKTDIQKNGLREPIWLFRDLIVDGRHRYRACEELGITPQFRVWDERGSLLDFVMSVNYYRRHLNESQRALAAAKAMPFVTDEARKILGAQSCSAQRMTRTVADQFNVGVSTVAQAVAVLREADPSLITAIENGAAKLGQAYNLLDLPKEEQAQVAVDGVKAIRKASNDARFRKRIGKLLDEGTPSLDTEAKFSIILADPPWPIPDATFAIPVQKIATSDALLFLWTPPTFVKQGIDLMLAWGFNYVDMLVWVDSEDNRDPGVVFWRDHRCLMVGAKGTLIPSLRENRASSVLRSEPERIYQIIEKAYPELAKISFYVRDGRPGWVAWSPEKK